MTRRGVQDRLKELQDQLQVAEETLRAIRCGEVDALIVGEEGQEQLYTLQTAEQPYRFLVEAMQQGALTLTHAGDVLYCNRFFADLVGLPLSQITGAPIRLLVQQEDEAPLAEALQLGRTAGASVQVRLRAPGRLVPVQVAISPFRAEPMLGVVAVVTDLTEPLRRTGELLFAHALAVDVAKAGHVDTALSLVVDRICSHMGWTAGSAWMPSSERRLRVCARRPSTHDANGAGQLAWTAFTTGDLVTDPGDTPCTSVAFPVVARERVVAVLVFHGVPDGRRDAPAMHASRAALAVLGAVIERKQAEEELRRSLVSQEELLYTIAHDLRGPNRAMHGYATLLHEEFGAALPGEAHRYLERIATAARRNDDLIVDLLEYGGLAHAPMPVEDIDLQGLVQDVQGELRDESRSVRASVSVDARLPHVIANRPRLRQVLVNLLHNAHKYGGDPPVIHVSAARQGDRVTVEIRDSGPGIPDGLEERVFEPFIRLPAAGRQAGTGMGLSIVRRAVERMGGRVGVYSPPGQGACFWFELAAA